MKDMNIFQFFTQKSNTYYLYTDCTIRQALEKFDVHKFSVVPLIDREGRYVTTVSEGDILRYIKNDADFSIKDAENTLVADISKYRPYKALDLRVPIKTVLLLSLEQNFIPLVDDRGMYMGILKRRAIIEYLYSEKPGNAPCGGEAGAKNPQY